MLQLCLKRKYLNVYPWYGSEIIRLGCHNSIMVSVTDF